MKKIRFYISQEFASDVFSFYIYQQDLDTNKRKIGRIIFEDCNEGERQSPSFFVGRQPDLLDEFIESLEQSGIFHRYRNKLKVDISSKDNHINDLRTVVHSLLEKI